MGKYHCFFKNSVEHHGGDHFCFLSHMCIYLSFWDDLRLRGKSNLTLNRCSWLGEDARVKNNSFCRENMGLNDKNTHKVFKLSDLARSYAITCDYSKRMLGTTMGHLGTWSNNTLFLFNGLIRNVKDRIIPDDLKFALFELNTNHNIIEVVYKGVWCMVDNSYLDWSYTVPPDEHGKTYTILIFPE